MVGVGFSVWLTSKTAFFLEKGPFHLLRASVHAAHGASVCASHGSSVQLRARGIGARRARGIDANSEHGASVHAAHGASVPTPRLGHWCNGGHLAAGRGAGDVCAVERARIARGVDEVVVQQVGRAHLADGRSVSGRRLGPRRTGACMPCHEPHHARRRHT